MKVHKITVNGNKMYFASKREIVAEFGDVEIQTIELGRGKKAKGLLIKLLTGNAEI